MLNSSLTVTAVCILGLARPPLIAAPPTAPQGGVVLVADKAHSQVGQPEGKAGINFTIPPTKRLTLDTRSFDFAHSLYPKTRPNAVQFIVGKDRQFSADYNQSGLTELSTSTLRPMNDSQPFDGVRAGDRVIVALGEQRLEDKKIVLKVLWVGLADVK